LCPSTPEYNEFGITKTGQLVGRFSLSNRNGLRAEFIEFGASLVELWVPDRQGTWADIVLGFDDLVSYEEHEHYFGCIVGRVANRVSNAEFELDGQLWKLTSNEGNNHLHGGLNGLSKVVWKGRPEPAENGTAVAFRYVSPAGEEGYPGNLEAEVIYTLTDDDALIIEYRAQSDRPTLFNPTNHTYWNLGGENVLGCELKVVAEQYLESDEGLIPSGRIHSVIGTPYDFRVSKSLAQDIDAVGGYDTTFVLSDRRSPHPALAAELKDPVSRRCITLLTTEPAIQLYTGNFLDGIVGKNGECYNRFGALCLEAQVHPDAINHDNFPDIVLRPHRPYYQKTKYKFSIL
jgi:aldose 1-epimerase